MLRVVHVCGSGMSDVLVVIQEFQWFFASSKKRLNLFPCGRALE